MTQLNPPKPRPIWETNMYILQPSMPTVIFQQKSSILSDFQEVTNFNPQLHQLNPMFSEALPTISAPPHLRGNSEIPSDDASSTYLRALG